METPRDRSSGPRQPFRLGDWLIEPELNRISGRDQSHRIEPKFMDLLVLLASRPGAVLSRSEILDTVWQDVVVGEEVLTRAISELRRILEDDPQSPRYIETIRKRGYRLVEEIAPVGEPKQIASRPRPGVSRRIRPVTVGLIVVIVLLATLWYVLDRLGAPSIDVAEADRAMLVVLPFENLGSAEEDYFADGITEEITTHLAKLSGLSVISRSSAMKYKGTDKMMHEIGDELGVDYALEGTIRWNKSNGADRVRISAQLIRVSDDTHLWADTFDRVYGEIFDLQSEIAEQVAAALNVTLLDPEREALQARPTQNLEAYDLYLQARSLLDRSTTRDEYRLAVYLFEQAVGLDSTFTPALAQLARVYTSDYFHNRFPEEPRLDQGRAAALAALRHAPDEPEGHVAMGYYYYYGSRDYDNALKEFAIAKEKQPNNSEVLEAMGFVQRRQGKWEEARENLKRAMDLDPMSLDKRSNYIQTLILMHQWEEADQYTEEALAFDPGYAMFYIYKAIRYMLCSGDFNAAQAVLDQMRGRFPEGMVGQFQTYVEFMAGEYNKTLERYRSLEQLDQLYVEPDSADYHLTKGALYDLVSGLEVESEIAFAHYDTARAMLENQLAVSREDPHIHVQLSMAYTGLRQKERALYHARRAVEILPYSKDAVASPELIYNLAIVQAMFGEEDAAFDHLEFLLSVPSYVTVEMLQAHPFLKSIQDNPRFERMARQYKPL